MESKHLNIQEELVSNLREGNIKALNQFFRELYTPLLYYCRNYVNDKHEAEDIVSTSFLKFWQNREKFENYSNAKSFLYLVVKNAALDFLKIENRRNTRFWEFALSAELIRHDTDYLELEAEILQRIYVEMEHLPGKCRKVFELSYLEGKSNTEIAEIMQISVSNVTSQRHRAIQLLRIALADSPLVLLYLLLNFYK